MTEDGPESLPANASAGRRSSSLSEVPRSGSKVVADSIVMDGNDTEAETERLEETPIKTRKHKDVVHRPSKHVFSSPDRQSTVVMEDDRPLNSSVVSTPGAVSDEHLSDASHTPSLKKRKRSRIDDSGLQEGDPIDRDQSESARSISPSLTPRALTTAPEARSPSIPLINSRTERLQLSQTRKQRARTGRRKNGILPVDEEDHGTSIDHAGDSDIGDAIEASSSAGEDNDGEENGDIEPENTAKSEEALLKKKAALGSLSVLEKCFATLRDRLFDERLASANEELSLLQQPGCVHPELLAMKAAVDERRNKKIEYQQRYLKYKLQTLQKESVAVKHQALSQYMQTVREVRDHSLDQLNKEFYQVQKERRNVEGDVPDYIYTFTTKRTQQISQQTSYNNEISVLSGIAKYVGFPAAPAVRAARPSETEEDLRSMGIEPQPAYSYVVPAPLRATYPGSVAMPRQSSTIEEQFIEKNAWANPQHAASHPQRQQMHRQISNISRVPTPTSTPSRQYVSNDTQIHGSASTIPEPRSGPASSLVPTPTTGNQAGPGNVIDRRRPSGPLPDATPSKSMSAAHDEPYTGSTYIDRSISRPQSTGVHNGNTDESFGLDRLLPNREANSVGGLPKQLSYAATAANQLSSPTARFPVKVEDLGPTRRHSPVLRQFSSPAPAIAAGNGQHYHAR